MKKAIINRKTGSLEWLQAYLYDRWQIIRRDPEYEAFCEGQHFDENGTLTLFEDMEPEAEEIRDKFRLETIFDPSKDIPKELVLEWPIFKKPLAVSYVWREEKPGVFSAIWEDHFIKLKIDVSGNRRKSQILSEVWEFVESARESASIEREDERFRPFRTQQV